MIWHVILQHSVQQGLLVMTVSMLLSANTRSLLTLFLSLLKRDVQFLSKENPSVSVQVLDTIPHTNLQFVALLYLLILPLRVPGDLLLPSY